VPASFSDAKGDQLDKLRTTINQLYLLDNWHGFTSAIARFANGDESDRGNDRSHDGALAMV
jgi:hypothetical protein